MPGYSNVLKEKKTYVLEQDFYCKVYKEDRKSAQKSNYMRGMAKTKMINFVTRLGECAQEHYKGGDMLYGVNLSQDEQKFIKEYGLGREYDWLFACYDMALTDEIYGQMVKNGALRNIPDEKIRLHAIMGMLGGYMYIAPCDPVVNRILDTFDILVPYGITDWLRNEHDRAKRNFTNGERERKLAFWDWKVDVFGNKAR